MRDKPERRARPFPELKKYALIVTWSLLAALILGEVYLRYQFRAPPHRYILPPNYLAYYTPTPAGEPGVKTGRHRFITNEFGLRGDPVPSARQRVIYVLGGSTSIDVWLDQPDAWPAVLQQLLNDRRDQSTTWVANVSKWGLSSLHHLMHFQDVIPYLPKPDVVVVLDGANDMQRALKTSYPTLITPEFDLQVAYEYVPPPGGLLSDFGYYRLYRRWEEIFRKLETGPLLGGGGDLFLPARRCRQSAKPEDLVHAYPDITPALADYRRNLEEIVDRSEGYGAKVILATQPTIWRRNMSPDATAILLSGGLAPFAEWFACKNVHYYAPETQEEALGHFNEVTRDVCRSRHLTCVDLERLIPKEPQYYYDDMHFTEQGAHLVAQKVASAILELHR